MSASRRFPRFLIWPVSLAMLLVLPAADGRRAAADETLLPPDALLKVQVSPLGALYEAPLARQVWSRLQESRLVQDSMRTVEAQQFRDAVTFLEQGLGRPWTDLAAQLTAGGIEIAVRVDEKPQLIVIAQAADEQLVEGLVQRILEAAPAEGAPQGSFVKFARYRGITGYRIGNAAVAGVGARLLIASHPDLLKSTVDRILDGVPPRTSDQRGEPFQLSAQLDLKRLRAVPGAVKGLSLPADDGGLITVFGGWIDLLRRHAEARLDVRLDERQIDARIRITGADAPSSPGLAGFWADAEGEHPAPLLRLPGTIYSTTWYRDYGALWEAREQLVTPEVVKRMERADADAAAQFEALGSPVALSDVVRQFGPRFRIVLAEQPSPPYDIPLRNELPAAALVVELRDEAAFREMSAPLSRVLHLILGFEQKITSQQLEYAGATLQQLSLPHTENDVLRRDRSVYNFRPAHCITRGHFILGSTPQIVRQTIDALDAQAAVAERTERSGVTSQQYVDVSRAADALEHFREGLVRRLVLEGGLPVETAGQELDVLLSVLRLFAEKSMTSMTSDKGFEQRVKITASPL